MSFDIEVNGQQRELRRLGISDIFMVQRITNEILAGAAIRGLEFNTQHNTVNELMAFLLAGIGFADQTIIAWVKSLIKDFPPEEELYLPDLMRLINGLMDHPDIKSFLELAAKFLEKLNLNLAERLKPSTQSD